MEAGALYIPTDLKVGFQKREDTYSGSLAYIIYVDHTGKVRKETSWESWRDKKIKPVEFKNEPTEGFVLNKKVGGYKSHWNFRDAHIRVYDPRGYEFEISVPNLLFILRECDCSRGKGLEGKFVYAWDGTELVLLPTSSADYQNSQNFTKLQAQSVGAKELVPGLSYTTKQQKAWTYLGRFKYWFAYEPDGYGVKGKANAKGVVNAHVFWNGEHFEYPKDLKVLAQLASDTPADNFAELVDKYNKSEHGSKVTSLFLKEASELKHDASWYYQDADGWFVECQTSGYGAEAGLVAHTGHRYKIEDGVLIRKYERLQMRKDGRHEYSYSFHGYRTNAWVEPTNLRLFAKHENGMTKRVSYSYGKDI